MEKVSTTVVVEECHSYSKAETAQKEERTWEEIHNKEVNH